MPPSPPTDGLCDLLQVIATLRGPAGCPWDRAQSERSLLPYLVEETYELVEAIEQDDPPAQCAEAGDLLYLLLLIARIAEERGRWDHDSAARGIAAKMRRRHPGILRPAEGGQVFSGSAGDWEAVKAAEHPPERSVLDGIPAALPALIRAHRVGEKVSRVGFDWPDLAGVRAKVGEEIDELDAALESGDPAAVRHELGDLLLASANLARFLGFGPEDLLREANARFEGRFRKLEVLARARGLNLHSAGIEQLEELWQEVKAPPTSLDSHRGAGPK